MILQRGEQRPRQGPSLRLKTSLRGKPGERAWHSIYWAAVGNDVIRSASVGTIRV